MSMEVITAVQTVEIQSPAARPSHWVSALSHLDPKYGGLSAAIPQLVSCLGARAGLEVSIDAFCLPGEDHRPAAYPDLSIAYWPTSRRMWLVDSALRQRLRGRLADADGLHIHGLWEQSSLVPARAARSLRVPYIVSAHGMLEPWALSNSRVKKQVYAALFERAVLGRAACLHALTRAEARNYRDFGCTQPIAVIPNGVDIPARLSPELFLASFPGLRDKRVMIFLGRLHRKKGVELLVRAWAQASPGADACLVIAGPPEDETRTRVEALVEELGLGGQVLLTGMLAPALKWSALAAAEAFVLPSYSEGLSIAALEAMGAGLPVLVTENCNLPEVVEQGAGWQVRADQQELAAALTAWSANAPAQNKAMGRRGAALVRERYSWATVAAQMAELYAWVEGGPAPRSFELQKSEAGQ